MAAAALTGAKRANGKEGVAEADADDEQAPTANSAITALFNMVMGVRSLPTWTVVPYRGVAGLGRTEPKSQSSGHGGPADCVCPGLLWIGEKVGLVDSAREENKARAVAKNYRIPLKRGR